MSTETNKAISLRMADQLWNERRLDLVEEYFTEDAIAHLAGQPPATGPAAVCAGINQTLTAFPDFRLTLDEIVAEDDRVALRWSITGTHTGEMDGIPPTGRPVNQSGTTFARLENGRIAEAWFLADMLGTLQQLGVFPAPDVASAGA